MLVVHGSGVVIAQDLIGAGDMLELYIGLFSLLLRDFVWMGGEGGFVVCFLDLGFRSRLGDVQDLYTC